MKKKNALTNKNILVISQQGEAGKSYIATNIGDQLRTQGKQCAVWLLDLKAPSTLHRLGKRDENGNLLEEQDPLEGVYQIDIDNQMNGGFDYQQQQKEFFFGALKAEIEYSVFDFPGQSETSFASHFKEGELEAVLSSVEKETVIVIPVINQKSLDFVSDIREMFTFPNNPDLNAKIRFVVAHNLKNAQTDLSYEKYLETDEHRTFIDQAEDRYDSFKLETINEKVLSLCKSRPFSYYLDDKFKVIKDRLPAGVERSGTLSFLKNKANGKIDETEFEIQVRRVLANDTGFINVVKKHFIGA